MAEVEISVLKRQCLDRRIPTVKKVEEEVSAWEQERNQKKATVEWRFTSQDARDKLTRLYPVLEQRENPSKLNWSCNSNVCSFRLRGSNYGVS